MAVKRRRPKVVRHGKLTKVQKKQVKMIVAKGVELKQFPSYSAGSVTSSGSMIRMTSISQGASGINRIGDECVLHKVTWRADALVAGGDEYNNVRFIVFRWYQDDNTSTPQVSDILDDTAGLTYRFMSPLNHQTRTKYHVMLDQTITVTNTFTAATQTSWVDSYKVGKRLNIYGRRLGRKTIQFTAAPQYGSNHIYLLVVSDSAAASATHPQYQFSAETWFSDS